MIQLLYVRPHFARASDIQSRFETIAEPHWNIETHRLQPGPSHFASTRNRPPDILLTDLSDGAPQDFLHQVRAAAEDRWGRSPRIPMLALFQARHLGNCEWHRAADDFQCAPYEPHELRARVRALLRHRIPDSGAQGLLQLPGTRIHTEHCTAEADDGRIVPLTTREFELLSFFARNRGRYFDRRLLIERVWGADFDGGERTVDVHIRRLRSKLPDTTAMLLETRHGFGYGLRDS